MSTIQDNTFMKTALTLASRAIGTTAPNPAVACVIVKDGHIIATGVTASGGRPHAEAIALKKAGKNAKGATAYVTLEPCCHHGKTPPCSEALIKAGIARVVIAIEDSYHQVNGGGIKQLRDAGIEVVTGICEEEAKKINAGFFKVQSNKRPYITLKLATSLDGRIATQTGESKWITCEKSREFSHYLRATNDAILVGIDTVFADNPDLTCRLNGMEEQSPIRIVLDSHLRIVPDCKLLQTAKKTPCWVLYSDKLSDTSNCDKAGAKAILCKENKVGRVDIANAMEKLAENGITRLLVEGGSKVITEFLKHNLADEIIWMRAPVIIGHEGIPAIAELGIEALASAKKFKRNKIEIIGNDIAEFYSSL